MNVPSNIQKTALVAAVTLAISGITTLDNDFNLQVGFSSVISSAYAGDGSSGGGHKGAMGNNKGGQGQQGQGGQGYKGGKSVVDIMHDDGGEDDEDSDRPDWAGVPGRDGKPGRPSAGSDNQKGGEYGDLFVILRNDDGSPVMVGDEYYIVLSDGTVVLTEGGEVPAGTNMDLVQEVEFGRMNIARAPQSVLDHSLVEALSKVDGLTITLDNIELYTDPAGRLSVDGTTIDSPVENLTLYQALLEAVPDVDGILTISAYSSHDGADTTYTLKVDEDARLILAASALAASSDKTGVLTIDEVVLISSFMGVDDELGVLTATWTYDREAVYSDEVVSVMVDANNDGLFQYEDVNLYIELSSDDPAVTYVDDLTYGFNDIERLMLDGGDPNAALIVDTDSDGIDIFTQAADDAVQAIEFFHEFE